MSNIRKTVHIDAVQLDMVLKGNAPQTAPVGYLRQEENLGAGKTSQSFETLFVSFDKATGAPRTSDKGRVTLNARAQAPKPEQVAVAGQMVDAKALEAFLAGQIQK